MADYPRAPPESSSASRLLARKLESFSPLAADAEEALRQLETRRELMPRRATPVVQGQPYEHLSVLIEGSAIRYKLLSDGRRQIVNFVLPGDFIGLHGCLFDTAAYSVFTLEACVVSPIKANELVEFVHRHAALSCAIFWLTALEQTMLVERLVSVGRRSAFERIGYLFLELLDRMQWIGLAQGDVFHLPVTQELIADTLGLSVVHVSRTLGRLRAEGLMTLADQTVQINDPHRLATVADYRPGTFRQRNPAHTSRALLWPGPDAQ